MYHKRRFFSEYAALQRVSHHQSSIYKRFFLPQALCVFSLLSFLSFLQKTLGMLHRQGV
jgi:hypothetical protein